MSQPTTPQAFAQYLKATLGEDLEAFKQSMAPEERENRLTAWEDNLSSLGLPNLEKANLVVLTTLMPLMEALEEDYIGSFMADFYAIFFILLDDALHPNSGSNL